MASPLLFDLGRRDPTTRDIANAVKLGGTEALTEAERRADEARYQTVTCRSALNPVKGMPFNWTFNPYRGCTHGCHYCFARRYHTQFEMNPDDDFASVILVKHNVVDVLQRELDKPTWQRAIEAFTRGRTPFGLVTKGPMVVRDLDVLQEQSRIVGCTVYMSVPTVDEDAWRQLEPGTAPPLQRLRAVKQLADAGINAGVLMAPIVPGFSSSPRKLERTVKAIADHGARFVGSNVMHLEDGTRDHFLQFIQREFPAMLPRFERLYQKKYAPESYRKEVQGMVRLLQERFGLAKRDSTQARAGIASEVADKEADQVAFSW
jgi:DNA repair photolyase